MPDIETVRGPVPVSGLGTTLMHEHVFVLNEEIRLNYPDLWDEDAQVASAIAKLRAARQMGVDTIADPTVLGLGRDIRRIARVNEQVDLNIVVATGLYTYGDVPLFFHYHGPGALIEGDEKMVSMFVADIEQGIGGTSIKAAFAKCAIERELTRDVKRVLCAVAETHKRTGVPIMVHTSPRHQTGLVAQDVLRAEGVDLTRVQIAHCGDTTDLDYLRRLLDAGSFLGMDRFGLDVRLATTDRVATVAALTEAGYASQLHLAHDASCHVDWFPEGFAEQMAPNWHHTYIPETVLPALRESGVSDEHIQTMLVQAPRAFFTAGRDR